MTNSKIFVISFITGVNIMNVHLIIIGYFIVVLMSVTISYVYKESIKQSIFRLIFTLAVLTVYYIIKKDR